MRIGLVRRGHSATGGAERYLLRFAEGLRLAGHVPLLFTDQPWPADVWDGETHVVPSRPNSPRAFADALVSLKPRESCDLLFSLERVWDCDVFRAGDGVHAAWLRRRASVEPWWKAAFRSWQAKHRSLLALEKRLYSPSGEVRVVANSPLVKQEITGEYATQEDRIAVIPNGYDAPPVEAGERAAWRQKLGLNPGETAILFVGSGWERKGLQTAITAVETLADRGHGARLFVAGEGKRRHLRIGRPDLATFLGPVPKLPPLYEAADLFVLPTLYDPFSNATLEAAAHGLPVVTTRANGASHYEWAGEALEHPGDASALAAALEKWLPEEKRRAGGAENRERARAFSVAENVRRTLDFVAGGRAI